MNEDDAVRFLAEMDQAHAGMGELAKLLGDFYTQLRRKGIPRRFAGEMTRDLQELMLRGLK